VQQANTRIREKKSIPVAVLTNFKRVFSNQISSSELLVRIYTCMYGGCSSLVSNCQEINDFVRRPSWHRDRIRAFLRTKEEKRKWFDRSCVRAIRLFANDDAYYIYTVLVHDYGIFHGCPIDKNIFFNFTFSFLNKIFVFIARSNNWGCHFKKGVNSVDGKWGLCPFLKWLRQL
jgi:hypothetical protein